MIYSTIKLKRATKARWEALNPVLADGEMGIEKGNPPKVKVGDGVTAWNDLPYMGGREIIAGRLTLTNAGADIVFDKPIGNSLEDYSITFSCFILGSGQVNFTIPNMSNLGFTVIPALEEGETCIFNYQIIPLT